MRVPPLRRKHSACPLQEVLYGWNWCVWPHPRAKITKTVDPPGRGQALGEAHRCRPSVGSGVQVTLAAGSSEGIGQVGQVDLSVPGERLVEHGDTLIEQRRRLCRLTQLKQAVTGTGHDLRWGCPVQPLLITIRLEMLDLGARCGDGRRASRSVPQGGDGVRAA
jgi:hypothetical protein